MKKYLLVICCCTTSICWEEWKGTWKIIWLLMWEWAIFCAVSSSYFYTVFKNHPKSLILIFDSKMIFCCLFWPISEILEFSLVMLWDFFGVNFKHCVQLLLLLLERKWKIAIPKSSWCYCCWQSSIFISFSRRLSGWFIPAKNPALSGLALAGAAAAVPSWLIC